MKIIVAFAFFVIIGYVNSGDALPSRKRMIYYQQPAAAEWYGAPQQRIMYMQYVQPGRTHARSTQAASALVAGETVATGTYLKDCDHAESDVGIRTDDSSAAETVDDGLSGASAHGVNSVDEAYPNEAPVVQIAVDTNNAAGFETHPTDDAVKVPREFNFAAEEAVPAAEEPAFVPTVDQGAVEEDLPAPAPIAPVAPAAPVNRYLPAKKKVIVELDQSAENADDEQVAAVEEDEAENTVADDVEEGDEEFLVPVKPIAKHPARIPNARRPAAKKPEAPASKPNKPSPLPAGTFFPIDFGGTNGGAIAIANSFSTGEGGSATSHAIAYGSPEAARARVHSTPSKRRH